MLRKLTPRKKESGDLQVRRADHPVSQLRQDFDQVWDRFWNDWDRGGRGLGETSFGAGLHVDFDDEPNQYVLRAELPGFEPEDLDVQITGNVLTLKAEHHEVENGKHGKYQRYGSFYETFSLPQGVRPDEIDAAYHSGVLEVRLPKSDECQSKRIAVKAK